MVTPSRGSSLMPSRPVGSSAILPVNPNNTSRRGSGLNLKYTPIKASPDQTNAIRDMKRKLSMSAVPDTAPTDGIKFYGSGPNRPRAASVALPKVSKSSSSRSVISIGNLFEDGLAPNSNKQTLPPATAATATNTSPVPTPKARPCKICATYSLRIDKLLTSETALKEEVARLHRRILVISEPKSPPPPNNDAENLLRALENEKASAVFQKDESEKELLRMMNAKKSSTDELTRRIQELENANSTLTERLQLHNEGNTDELARRIQELESLNWTLTTQLAEKNELCKGYLDLTDDLRGQLGDANTSHELTKTRLNAIIANLRSSLEMQTTKANGKNSELTRIATELQQLQRQQPPRVSSSATQMTPPKPTPVSSSPDILYTEQKNLTKTASTQTKPAPTPMKSEQLLSSLQKLEVAVLGELKAIQRHGHLLNLSNASTTREMKLEIDGFQLRLEAAKEQQNVLLFCLQTAETKLSETSPETAEKVKKSKEARMALIKESLAGKMSELDHRSAGTSFMTGEKLRDLLPSAKDTWDEQKVQRERLMEALKEAVGGDTSSESRRRQIGGEQQMLSGTRG